MGTWILLGHVRISSNKRDHLVEFRHLKSQVWTMKLKDMGIFFWKRPRFYCDDYGFDVFDVCAWVAVDLVPLEISSLGSSINISKQMVWDDPNLLGDNGEVPKSKWRDWRCDSWMWNLLSTWRKHQESTHRKVGSKSHPTSRGFLSIIYRTNGLKYTLDDPTLWIIINIRNKTHANPWEQLVVVTYMQLGTRLGDLAQWPISSSAYSWDNHDQWSLILGCVERSSSQVWTTKLKDMDISKRFAVSLSWLWTQCIHCT